MIESTGKDFDNLSMPTIKENDDGTISLIFEKRKVKRGWFIDSYEVVGHKEIKFNDVDIIEDSIGGATHKKIRR